MMRPERWRTIGRAAALQVWKRLVRSTRRAVSQSSWLIIRMRRSQVTPALLTRMSMRPPGIQGGLDEGLGLGRVGDIGLDGDGLSAPSG